MGEYTDSKSAPGLHEPEDAIDSAWQRVEPLITAKQLRRKFLFGLPLKSSINKDELADDDLDRFIEDAIAEAESESGIHIMPTQHKERYPFDQNEYLANGYLRLKQKPVQSIESMKIVTANGDEIYSVPLQWIDVGYLSKGQINIIPIATLSAASSGSTASSAFLTILATHSFWIPSFFTIIYTSGFLEGRLPRIINQLIGCYAAISILDLLQTTNAKAGSHSLSIGSVSQSNSNNGPELYTARIGQLEKKKKELLGQIKNQFGTKFIVGTI